MRSSISSAAVWLAFLTVLTAAQEPTTEQHELRRFRELAFEQRGEQDTDAAARRDMERFHGKAEEAADILSTLLAKAERLFSHVDELLTSDTGKRLATEEQSVLAVQRLEQDPPVSLHEVRTNKRLADMILQAAKDELSLANVGRRPTDKSWEEVNGLVWNAKRTLPAVEQELSSLEGLIAHAPQSVDLNTAPTMRAVIDEANARQLKAVMEAILEGRKQAKAEAHETLVGATYLAELKEAAEKAKDIEIQNQIAIERIRQDYEAKLTLARQEQKARRAELELALEEQRAEVERLKKLERAERHARDIEAENLARETIDDAEYERKNSLAQSPEVQELLKPFITKGYYQPGGKSSFEKTGVSLNLIRSRGALEQSERGLVALHAIGTDQRDTERPRLGMRKAYRLATPQQKDELKRIQAHLIDLGEVLVELGMLAP